MNALFQAAAELLAFCAAREWRCCLIGGLAVQRWGEPRQTRDVDLALLTGIGGEAGFVEPLLSHYRPRVPDARRFALNHRVVLVETVDRIPLDISLAALPFEARVMDRSSAFSVSDSTHLTTCSADDLIVLKALAARPQDWLDIEGVLARQGPAVNRGLVIEELRPLLELKEDDEAESMLRRLFAKHAH